MNETTDSLRRKIDSAGDLQSVVRTMKVLDASSISQYEQSVRAFASLSMMGLQFFLTGRFKRITSPYGIDVVCHFHRQISLIATLFSLVHLLILIVLFRMMCGSVGWSTIVF
jgi:predicted ferric reductase